MSAVTDNGSAGRHAYTWYAFRDLQVFDWRPWARVCSRNDFECFTMKKQKLSCFLHYIPSRLNSSHRRRRVASTYVIFELSLTTLHGAYLQHHPASDWVILSGFFVCYAFHPFPSVPDAPVVTYGMLACSYNGRRNTAKRYDNLIIICPRGVDCRRRGW